MNVIRRLALVSLLVVGQAKANDPAAAEALFLEARDLFVAGKVAAACTKFESSYKLDPAPGTLLNLAACLEKDGRIASAWQKFRETVTVSNRLGQTARETEAKNRAARLEPRLPKWLVRAPADLDARWVVERDGVELDRGTFGSALPIDPGRHRISARFGAKELWYKEFTAAEKTLSEIEVPTLATPVPPVVSSPAPVSPLPLNNPTPAESSGSAQRTIGIVIGTVGLAGIAASVGLYLSARSIYSGARDRCTLDVEPQSCPEGTNEEVARASDRLVLSQVVGYSGGALLLGGVIMWLTAPRSSRANASASMATPPARIAPWFRENALGATWSGSF